MITTYFRSSSYSRWDWCPHAYFIEYNLGWLSSAGKKADLGTIVHKVLEILANIQMAHSQDIPTIDDDLVGIVDLNNYSVDLLIEQVYEKYTKSKPDIEWELIDFKTIKKWVYNVLNHDNGKFDPRNLSVVGAEVPFDIAIDRPWAKYDYNWEGRPLQGNLALKGKIDLVISHSPDIMEVVDWKTGKRWDWNTDTEKTYDKLRVDPQLRMYHWAVHGLFPQVKQVIISIFWIKDGGPFSFCFTDQDLIETELMLRKRFEEVRDCQKPLLIRSWKCKKLCHYGKKTFEETGKEVQKEFRYNQLTDKGTPMCMCSQLEVALNTQSIERVTKDYVNPEFKLGEYKNG